MNSMLRILVTALLAGLTLLATAIAIVVVGLCYYPTPFLDMMNRQLAPHQISIDSFEISSLGFNQAHITNLSILSPQGPLTLKQIELKYSLTKLQLQQLNVGQALFSLKTALGNQTPEQVEPGNTNKIFLLSTFLEQWKQVKPLRISLKKGRLQWQDRTILIKAELEHQLENDQLSFKLEQGSLLVNSNLSHRWKHQQQYSSVMELELNMDSAGGSASSAASLIKVDKAELAHSPTGWGVSLGAELALAQIWEEISPWLKVDEIQSVSGKLELEVDGQLRDNILGLNEHQLKLQLKSPEGLGADLRMEPLAQAPIHLSAKLPGPIVLEWQQGLKLSAGELHLQLSAGDKQLNAELRTKQCDASSCVSVYQLIAEQGSWSKTDLGVQWQEFKTSGELRWQQGKISSQGQLALKLNELRAQGIKLSDVSIQAPHFELNVEWPKKLVNIELRIPTIVAKESQLQWRQGAASIITELTNTELSYGEALNVSTEVGVSLANLTLDGLKLPGAGFKGHASLINSALKVDGLLSSDTASELLSLQMQYQLDHQQGYFNLASKMSPFDSGKQRLSKHFSRWPFDFDLIGGEVKLSSQGQFYMSETLLESEHKTRIILKDVNGVYDDLLMMGLSFDDELQFQKQSWSSSGSGKLRLAMLDVGLAVENIQAQLSVSGSQATVSVAGFEAEVLEGKWLFDDFHYSLAAEHKQTMMLRLKGIQLAEIIRQAQYDGLEAQASISGRLPITVEAGVVTVGDGDLRADEPGYLRYAGLGGGDNQLLGVVSKALSNYHFKSLTSTVDYGVTGELDLGVRMIGENPDMQQKVNVNLNVNDDIPSLLKSLRAGRVVSDLIEAKLN